MREFAAADSYCGAVPMAGQRCQGWATAHQLIEAHPEIPHGWIFRATIQQQQARAGLKDTGEYFEKHFSHTPGLKQEAVRLHSALILQTHSGSRVLAGKPPTRGSSAPAARRRGWPILPSLSHRSLDP